MRIDKYLFENNYCDSRAKAQEMIVSGAVFVNGKVIKKSSFKVCEGDKVETQDLPQHKYVSRAGYKLEKALHKAKLSVASFNVLDIGQSTGGFTDCLIKSGARKVVGLDVGTGQLHESLKDDPKIMSFENINAKNLSQFLEDNKFVGLFDLIVMDLSFISMTKVAPYFSKALKPGGRVLSLVKPQFELGPKALDSYGVVKDISLYHGLEEKIKEVMGQEGFRVIGYFESELEGKSGNKEFFVYAEFN